MARSCSECGVRDRALCAGLSDEELAPLGKLGIQRRLARGDTLVHAGDTPLACANLQSGVMKITSLTPAGSESIVGLLYPGDFVGQPFGTTNDQDVVALTDVELCMFPRTAFERAMADHQRMERLLLQRTLAELDRARRWLTMMGRATAGARVAGFLDDMGRRLTVPDCQHVALETDGQRVGVVRGLAFDLPLSRGEIADFLGLTIETVSRQMTRLRAAGVIGLPGGRGIVVNDPQALAAASEEFV